MLLQFETVNTEQFKTEDESWRLVVLTSLFLAQPVAPALLCKAVLVPALTPGKGSLAEVSESWNRAHTGWAPVIAEEFHFGLSIPT